MMIDFACYILILAYYFLQPTQDSDDMLSDEQIARALQMDEDMEVGRSLAVPAVMGSALANHANKVNISQNRKKYIDKPKEILNNFRCVIFGDSEKKQRHQVVTFYIAALFLSPPSPEFSCEQRWPAEHKHRYGYTRWQLINC